MEQLKMHYKLKQNRNKIVKYVTGQKAVYNGIQI